MIYDVIVVGGAGQCRDRGYRFAAGADGASTFIAHALISDHIGQMSSNLGDRAESVRDI